MLQRLESILRIVLILAYTDAFNSVSFEKSRQARSSSTLLASPNEENAVPPHGYEVTTKTSGKTLVFDEKAGRFFEKPSDESFFPSPLGQTVATQQQQELIASRFPNNEMVPTEILFGAGPRDILSSHDLPASQETPTNNREKTSYRSEASGTSESTTTTSRTSIVEECYAAWNRGDMDGVVDCFADGFEYQDAQYLGSFTNKQELRQHFSRQAELLPSDSQIVLENIAICPNTGNIATQWHVERKSDGSVVPFTRGCTFYTMTNSGSKITHGFRVSEMVVKPSKASVDRLVAAAASSGLLASGAFGRGGSSGSGTAEHSSSQSIIEQYFDAWNNRDMKSALACFAEDCVYQTEDPVFVDTFQGKNALRQHLEKNAASLPGSCRIVLDQIASDPSNGNIGTRWHLEVNGFQIPNLRGCSMYTTTKEGLLQTGFDVTEAPVKIPKQTTSLLSFPAKLLFGTA